MIMDRSILNIGVLGAGSWGTTLALHLYGLGHRIALWEFRPEAARLLQQDHENAEFLPGVPLPEDLEITSDLAEACAHKDIWLVVVPSHVIRSVVEKMVDLPLNDTIIVSATKGIENHTLYRVSEIFRDVCPHWQMKRIAALSGPSLAREVCSQIPTSVVVASPYLHTAQRVQHAFFSPTLRVYSSQDLIGVELGGALKNVIALAAGICDGLGYGDNTKGALLTRGLAEITRLGTALGGKRITFAGLSGMGDLITTCNSPYSRNRSVGEQIGRGRKLQDILSEMVMVAEGVRTSQSAYDLSRRHSTPMPISEQAYNVLFHDKDPRLAVEDLMMRDLKVED
jgi:glycerol-3-phosphate dehydrogenase (NAD(P)+)